MEKSANDLVQTLFSPMNTRGFPRYTKSEMKQTTDVGDATGAKGPKVTAVNFESGFSGNSSNNIRTIKFATHFATHFDQEPVAIPVELLEVILLKAIATLYAVYGVHLLLGADVTSLMCVSSVCYEWYAIVTGRKFNRQRLHYLLRKKMEIRGPPLNIPLSLLKACVMYREHVRRKPLLRRNADAEALKAVAAVCRHWAWIIRSSNSKSRQLLRRLFHSPPQLTHVVRFDVDGRHSRVVGVTSLDSRHLFVLLSPSQQRIEVYDKETFGLQRTLNVAGLGDDEWGYNGMTSCVTNNCLYVNDWRLSSVFKVRLSPDDHEVLKWQVDEMPSGLAVNAARNLLVTCCRANKLLEYTPNGSLVREIRLVLNDTESSPFHAIQLTDGDLFVVCLHRALDSMPGDVVEVNSEGRVVISYKKQLLSTCQHQFDWPRHLAVDKNSERIFVADYYNGRIVVLSRSSPARARDVSASIDGIRLRSTRCLCFDDDTLYVGEGFRGGRVFVFDIRRH